MSKLSTSLIVLLLAVVGVQSWFLLRADKPAATTVTETQSPATNESLPFNPQPASQDELARQLARIDARLAALEQNAPSKMPVVEQKIVLGSPEALAADRKIMQMLPKQPITHEELMLFQAQLGQYPPEEQFQLSAALSRAINNGKIQPRLN